MANAQQTLQVYERLAEWYDHENQPKLRDWFLVLAADAAQTAGQADQAERLRGRLLQRNPHHLLKPFASFAEALRSPDVQGYVADLRRTYPPAAAEQLLKTQQLKNNSTAEPGSPRTVEKPAAETKPTASPPEEGELKVYRIRAEPEDLEEPALPMPRQAPPPRPAPRLAAPPAPPVPVAAPPPPPAPPLTPPAPPLAPPAPPPARLAPPVLRARPAPEKEPAVKFVPVPGRTRYPGPTAPRQGEPPIELTPGAWLATCLFVLLLLLSLGLAAYTLARPFLPEGWFR